MIEHDDALAPAKMHKAVIASEAKQSIHPLCRAMDCFASLAMTRRVLFASIQQHSLCAIMGSRIHIAHNFFIIFVDGMFTTFSECPFTNTPDASVEIRAISCV